MPLTSDPVFPGWILPDGRYAICYNPIETQPYRYPLIAITSDDADATVTYYAALFKQFTVTYVDGAGITVGSELVEICRKEYRALTGEEIRVEPVHAGLECGGFSHSNPALDIISIGPTILDIHSPRETLLLDTVYGCDALVRNILKDIALK